MRCRQRYNFQRGFERSIRKITKALPVECVRFESIGYNFHQHDTIRRQKTAGRSHDAGGFHITYGKFRESRIRAAGLFKNIASDRT